MSFESKYGPLTYATDAFLFWKDNVRAIALGLTAPARRRPLRHHPHR
jgi:hypothetical protein